MYYENFQRLCEERGVKPGTVSKATGVSTTTLTHWKQGKYTPKQDKLQKIADYFQVPLEEITKSQKVTIKVPHYVSETFQQYSSSSDFREKIEKLIEEGVELKIRSNVNISRFYDLFNTLNETGKDMAIQYLEFLAGNPAYTKDTVSLDA